jgi:hypothetical protein
MSKKTTYDRHREVSFEARRVSALSKGEQYAIGGALHAGSADRLARLLG